MNAEHSQRQDNPRLGRQVEAVLFDMDGTLTRPVLDFDRIKQAMGCPRDETILEWLATLPPAEQVRLEQILIDFEIEAARNAIAAAGATDLIDWLYDRDYRQGIITRNCHQAVTITLERCKLDVRTLWTREDIPRKPSGDAVAGLCRRLEVAPARAIVVGDYKFDLEAARAAGAGAVLLLHDKEPPEWVDLADAVIRDLHELKGLLQ